MPRGWWSRRPDRLTPEESGGGPSAEGVSSGRVPRTLGPEDEALLNRIARAVDRWGMTVPAIFLLESSKPLNFVGGQFLHFLSPIVHSVVDAKDLDRLALLLERRDTVEELIRRIERADAGDLPRDPRTDAPDGEPAPAADGHGK